MAGDTNVAYLLGFLQFVGFGLLCWLVLDRALRTQRDPEPVSTPVEGVNSEDEFRATEATTSLHRLPYKFQTTLLSPVLILVLWWLFRLPAYGIRAVVVPEDRVVLTVMGMALVFVHTVFYIDSQIFDVVVAIRSAFDTYDRPYYRFFGEFVAKLYHPLPHTSTGDSTEWRRFASLAIVAVSLVTYGVQFLPTAPEKPFFEHSYFVFLTFLGLAGICVLLWIQLVVYQFMFRRIRRFRIEIVPPVSHRNLGLRRYIQLVIGVLIRLSVPIGLGIFALASTPSVFIYTLVGLNVVLVVVWFVITQYGLHEAIVASKAQLLCGHRPSARGGMEMTAAETYDYVQRLPDWPVTVTGFLEVAVTAAVPLISLLLRTLVLTPPR